MTYAVFGKGRPCDFPSSHAMTYFHGVTKPVPILSWARWDMCIRGSSPFVRLNASFACAERKFFKTNYTRVWDSLVVVVSNWDKDNYDISHMYDDVIKHHMYGQNNTPMHRCIAVHTADTRYAISISQKTVAVRKTRFAPFLWSNKRQIEIIIVCVSIICRFITGS